MSDALAKLNYQRFQDFEIKAVKAPSESHKQAVLSFNGPAYLGLAANELSASDLQYAQDHLRILCGLYGILRPLDLIQAYRLEMGQKLANARGKDLYAFWGSILAESINEAFKSPEKQEEPTHKVLVNVASQEYFKSIARSALDEDIRVLDCVFQDNGTIKSVYAKRARGLMCRYLIQNQVDSIEGVQQFDLEGYEFVPKASSESTLVFNRSPAKQKAALQANQAKAKRAKEAAAKGEIKIETAVVPKPKKTAAVKKTSALKTEEPKQETVETGSTSLRRSTRKKQRTS